MGANRGGCARSRIFGLPRRAFIVGGWRASLAPLESQDHFRFGVDRATLAFHSSPHFWRVDRCGFRAADLANLASLTDLAQFLRISGAGSTRCLTCARGIARVGSLHDVALCLCLRLPGRLARGSACAALAFDSARIGWRSARQRCGRGFAKLRDARPRSEPSSHRRCPARSPRFIGRL